MAVLGSGGKLELRREAPSPCVITPEDLNLSKNTFELHCEGYWPGDKVVISAPGGLPIFINGIPQRYDSVATYQQSYLFVAANRDHISSNTDDFYKKGTEAYYKGNSSYQNNDALFYYQGEDEQDTETGQLEGYLCIDALGRAVLYETKCEGLSCCGTSQYSFSNGNTTLDFDFFVINPFGSGEYQNAVTACFGDIGEYVFNDIAEDDGTPDPNRRVDSICNDPPKYLKPAANANTEAFVYDNADVQPRGNVNQGPHPLWTVLCEIREWSLNLDAPSVDTTGVGEKFGNSVKSLVSGGGSVEFFIDKKCYEDGVDNGTYLMRLLLMTQMDGCRAKAKFYMMTGKESCGVACGGSLGGNMWYETDILVVQNAVNLRPDEMVAGTANFVTTGEIKLQMGQD